MGRGIGRCDAPIIRGMESDRDDPTPHHERDNGQHRNGEAACALCGRVIPAGKLTRHHLVPRSRTRKTKRRRRGEERRAAVKQDRVTVWLCRPCHGTIHATLSEKQLERDYPTLEALQAHPQIARFVEWVRKQDPHRRVQVRWSASRRGAR